MRSNTSGVRYHSPNNDLDDVKLEDDEFTAQYTNTPLLGTATLETTCRGDTTDQQRASQHTLAIENSARQNETNTSHGYTCS